MHHDLLIAATMLAATASSGKNFHIGPWIIVPILILVLIVGTPIYIARDRRRRRAEDRTR